MGFAGFNAEPLFNFSKGTVIDAIPASERDKYYLRGASIGGLALNLAHGVNRVNMRDDLYMHVTYGPSGEGHEYAYGHADMLSRGGAYHGHFSLEEAEMLAGLTGRTGVHAVPAIVFGIPRANHELVRHPANFQLVIGAEVPFSDIDPHSQAMLSAITGVDVANLPLTPGATRPTPETIDIY
jgi:hypothetical protein